VTRRALAGVPAAAQLAPDPGYRPMIGQATFAKGKGPAVGNDEAHHNGFTLQGEFQTFANLLRADGYVVRSALLLIAGW
jgi:hypothetical protein